MFKKIFLGILILLIVVIGGMVIYVQASWNKTYDIPYPDLQTSTDSAVIARGKYLVHGPAHCSNCHVATIEEMVATDAGEPIPLRGGAEFSLGPLGSLFTKNLTPDPTTGIGRYTDGQVFRMMRHAVKPDGTASIALLMPFWKMADEDLIAVVSYLRTMAPIENKVSDSKWTFMGKAVKVISPTFQPIENPDPSPKAPPMEATVERGEYLAKNVANCVACHTKRDLTTFEAIGPEFAGGMEFEPFPEMHLALGEDPELWMRSPNITPHPNSALSKFKTVEEWKVRFRKGRQIKISPMHWGPFSRMSDEDLEALYLFLHSLEPVEHEVGELMFKK
ncbi:cytochrome c [Algoriphagus aestuariicola]|jgi:mono/diheme cytochrome c family protein|uniref:Cytochrome c n=1 Tax=Algoriphagus aestuariicola TaxID=1852016 RepID=A0ABS3BSV1_9BACT|nr:cytochrome c [Algoriphagus aestuariicola]MBN7802383.1 cytochrome c [Algoriphagus aestuariicola]